MKKDKSIIKFSWIVYMTINIVNRNVYVGVHKTATPDTFDGYLGCGVYATQLGTYKNPKTHFQRAVKKYGPKKFMRVTLKTCSTDKEAFQMESEIVNEEFVKREDTYNSQLGGLLRRPRTRRIYVYDLNGKFINEYESIKEATLALGKCSHVSRAVGNKLASMGYQFSYEKLDHMEKNKMLIRKEQRQQREDLKIRRKQEMERDKELAGNCPVATIRDHPVYVYDLNGDFIHEYKTASEAAEALGNSGEKGHILRAIKHGYACMQHQFSLTKVAHMPRKTSAGKPKSCFVDKRKKVGQFDDNGTLIRTFDNITECRKAGYINANKCVKGLRDRCNGYRFKYID